jgi:hypothetical protein
VKKELITISRVRGILKSWGDLVRSYGDDSPDGWMWTTEIVIEKLQEEKKRAMDRLAEQAKGGKPKREEASLNWTPAEQRLRLIDIARLREVATVARFIREQRPLRVAVLAHLYGHNLSVEDTALQLGAKTLWVLETRRETEKDFMHWCNGLRDTHSAPTVNHEVSVAA